MKGVLATIIGVLVLAIAIAAFAPATLVDARVASISRGALRVADAQGTLWRGRGVLTPADGRWRVPVAWSLDPLPLANGVTTLVFDLPDDAAYGMRGRVELATQRATASELVARFPASVVTSLSGPVALHAGGNIDVRTQGLALAPTGSTGNIDAQWRNARLAGVGIPVVDFGTLSAKLTVRGNALAGPVSSRGGAVDVSGTVSVDAERVAVDLRLAPSTSASPAVRKALETLGPADANGAVALRVDRSLRN